MPKESKLELWFPLSAHYPSNPKIFVAGYAASMVHIALIMAAKKSSQYSGGEMPATCWRPEFLLSHLGVWAERIKYEEVKEAMQVCVDQGLVEFEIIDGKKFVKPHDYEHYNNMARRQIYREDNQRKKKSTSKSPVKPSKSTSKSLVNQPVEPSKTDKELAFNGLQGRVREVAEKVSELWP